MFHLIPIKYFATTVCLISTLALQQCDSLDKAHDRIQKVHQLTVANCAGHTTQEQRDACVNSAIDATNAAHNKLRDLWLTVESENYEKDEDFKRRLMELILEMTDGPIKEILKSIIADKTNGEDEGATIEGSAAITGPPAIMDTNTLLQLAEAPKTSQFGLDPIRLVTKQLLIDAETSIGYSGQSIVGQLTGSIIVRVGEGQVGPRQIQVISGSLVFTSPFPELNGEPIVYEVQKNSNSRMIVSTNGETVLSLDVNGSSHPFSYVHDENPIFEIPMTETSDNNFQISVSTTYGYL